MHLLKLSGKKDRAKIGEVPYFRQGPEYMFDMCSFFSLFCRAVDEKETEMDHVLQFFQQLDNLVWGAPLLVLLVGTGIT